jgi:hypothetical protein
MPNVAAPAPLTSASAFACAHFIDLVVDEVLTNVVMQAYSKNPENEYL